MNSTIRELIDNPHPIYSQYYNYFQFLLQSYEGGIDYCGAKVGDSSPVASLKDYLFKIFVNGKQWKNQTNGNLFAHPKEREEDYNRRLNMAYYYNFCSPVIDIYTDHLFKQSINTNWGSIEDDVNQRSENIDNKGASIGEFRKELADMAQIYGHVFVITDSPEYEGQILTKADKINNGLYPYFTIHHPQNVINWALDEFGRPYWVLIREISDSNQDPFAFDKENRVAINYRLWTREEWILYNAQYQEIGRGTHGLGVVPITCIFDKQSKKFRNFLGISAIADIAFIARDIFNSCSELKQILRDQTFAFLAIQGNSGDYSELEIATNKGILYPRDTNAPQYVSPPPANAQTYFDHIDRQVSKIFQLAKLEGGSASFQGQDAVQQSGVAKAWDFNQTNSALSKKAGNLEDGETKLWQMFALWNDKEFDGSVEYPHEFDIKTLNADIDEAEKMMRLTLGADFNKEVKKAIMQKKFPRMNEKDMAKMIDTMETQEDKSGEGQSDRLFNRIPSFQNRMVAQNANSSGKERG